MKMRSIQHAGSSSTALRAAEASLVMPSPCLFLARDILFHTCFVYPLASFCACFSMLKVKIYSENPGHTLPERLWMQSENHRIMKHLKLEGRRTIESNCWLHTAPLKKSDQREAKIRSVLFSEQNSFDNFTDHFWTGQNRPHFGLSKKTPTWVSAKALPAPWEANIHMIPTNGFSLPSHGFGCIAAGIPSPGKKGLWE